MPETAQQRALTNYRNRLADRGLARFEVIGCATDRILLRALATRLAKDGPDAARIRQDLNRSLTGEPATGPEFLAALMEWSKLDADLDLVRPEEPGRTIDL